MHRDLAVVIAVLGAVVMMVIPLPPGILDILLTLNITLALVVVLLSMYARGPLDFSVLPSLLLLATIFRLSLNVSSTRLILLTGNAGKVIASFGKFVVGGNPVVGFIIFLILVIIQFIVITRGAERVAEVAARFTLDALPGRQMSIDADLNAGLIDQREAVRRRKELRRESDFYGAMDGASKFVKGDAIAGIIITVINICGGLIVGMVQRGLPLAEAVQVYTLLTVGDGLVTQIPALLISTGTGIVVTRSASESSLGADVTRELTAQPRIMFIAMAVLMFFAILPGLPTIPFVIMSLGMGYLGYSLSRAGAGEVRESEEEEPALPVEQPQDVVGLIQVDPLEIEVGYNLLPLADPAQGGDIKERIIMIRKNMALELGMLVPVVRIRDNFRLAPNAYQINVRGVEVATYELRPGQYLAMDPGTAQGEIEGTRTREPAFGLPAIWVTEEERDKARDLGYTVVDAPTVLATHLTEVIRNHARELLGRREVQLLLDTVKEDNPRLVEELVPEVLTLGSIQKVLANLLEEAVPIRDLVTILETLTDYGPLVKDPALLTEYVRQALRRQITSLYRKEGPLKVVTLHPKLEGQLLDNLQGGGEEAEYLPWDLDVLHQVTRRIAKAVEGLLAAGGEPVLLVDPRLRRHIREAVGGTLRRLAVISSSELEPTVDVESVAVVSLDED